MSRRVVLLVVTAVLALAALGLWTNALVRWAVPPSVPAAPPTSVPPLTGAPFVTPTPSGVVPSR